MSIKNGLIGFGVSYVVCTGLWAEAMWQLQVTMMFSTSQTAAIIASCAIFIPPLVPATLAGYIVSQADDFNRACNSL